MKALFESLSWLVGLGLMAGIPITVVVIIGEELTRLQGRRRNK